MGRLALLTPYSPTGAFRPAAMGRNKVIYGLADFAVVVSSDYRREARGQVRARR